MCEGYLSVYIVYNVGRVRACGLSPVFQVQGRFVIYVRR